MAIPEGDEYTVSIQKEFTLYGLRLRSTFTNLLRGVIDTVQYGTSTSLCRLYGPPVVRVKYILGER